MLDYGYDNYEGVDIPEGYVRTGPGNGGAFRLLPVDEDGVGVRTGEESLPFTAGQCHAFAYHLSKLTGWPVAIIGAPDWEPGENASWDHAVCLHPDGGEVDIDGWHESGFDSWFSDRHVVDPDDITERVVGNGGFPIPDHAHDAARAYARLVARELGVE